MARPNRLLLASAGVLSALAIVSACSTASEPETDADVLALWVTEAFGGNIEAQGELLTEDVVWIGIWELPGVVHEGRRRLGDTQSGGDVQ